MDAPSWISQVPFAGLVAAGLFIAGLVVRALWRAGRATHDPLAATGSRASSGDVMDEVSRLLAAGRKVEAVRFYRDATGAGLKESLQAVSALERPSGPGGSGTEVALSEQARTQVLGLITRGRKIEAIKAYRDATGVGPAQAKDSVERLARSET